jgi:CRP-like cAMP-binding protein
MDTFSAVDFFTEGFMGHASYTLLILSSLMRRMLLLRAFFIASALAGISYSLFWLGDFVGVFWESLLLIVNLTQLVLLASKDARARFTEEEAEFVESWLSGGTPSSRRALLNLGRWETLDAGTQLTTRGERPHDLVFLSRGEADVSIADLPVARIAEGHFVGEMSLLGDELASADVRLAAPSRVWRIKRSRLDEARMRQPELFGIIEVALALSLRAKLIATNDRLVGQATPADRMPEGLAGLPA